MVGRAGRLAAPLALVAGCTFGDMGGDTSSWGDFDTSGIPDAILLSLAGGGSTAASFVADQGDSGCPSACDGNTAPELGEATFLVNGSIQSSPPSQAGDSVAILIGYRDSECNVACGSETHSLGTPGSDMGDSGSLPSNLPCDTDSSGIYLGFDLGSVEAGEYTYSLQVSDACGLTSRKVDGSFTL